ncbi:Gap junction gamma-2 protein [Merluccius polli]|uniref:Gap junction protein n=1 Tax=Merluccius polli TaxID=89951 RepID=A0AA47NBT5_MERPO|nr:Gap junction gamma-2 protein [Merluccius polli]
MSWSFLTSLLDEISNHSTFVGKVWLSVLIIFRIVLTAVGGESIYSDEQSVFVCNTQQPGCENVCYDAFAPISHIRFWVFQVIVVTTPTIMYLGFAMHKIARMDNTQYQPSRCGRKPIITRGAARDYEEAVDDGEEDPVMEEEIEQEKNGVFTRPWYNIDYIAYRNFSVTSWTLSGIGCVKTLVALRVPLELSLATRVLTTLRKVTSMSCLGLSPRLLLLVFPTGQEKKHDGRRQIQRDGLMRVYTCQLLSRTAFELAFLYGQYVLYGFQVAPMFVCTLKPCPHTVDCFVSRPTEKTIFLLVMYVVSCLCLLLTLLEIVHLGVGGVCDTFRRRTTLASRPKPQPPALACRRLGAAPTSIAPPGYHAAMKRDRLKEEAGPLPLADSRRKSPGVEGCGGPELDRLRRHIRQAQRQLDLVYQLEERSLPRAAASRGKDPTAAEQNRRNLAQEKRAKGGNWV